MNKLNKIFLIIIIILTIFSIIMTILYVNMLNTAKNTLDNYIKQSNQLYEYNIKIQELENIINNTEK